MGGFGWAVALVVPSKHGRDGVFTFWSLGRPCFKALGLNFAPSLGLGGTMPQGDTIQQRGVAFGAVDKGGPLTAL